MYNKLYLFTILCKNSTMQVSFSTKTQFAANAVT